MIEVIINKMDLQHFAEFKQTLPEGFSAIEANSGSADFSFKDQQVKFTWLRLPREPKITVSYKIQVSEHAKGKFKLPGQFIYIYKNQRGIAGLENDIIHVFPKGQGFISKSGQNVQNLSFPPNDPKKIQCLRLKPVYSQEDNTFLVKLLVSTGSLTGASRIEEILPDKYTATAIETGGANFTFDNNKAIFTWKKKPSKKNFEIIYRVSSVNRHTSGIFISGNFYYFSDGKAVSQPVYDFEQQ